MELVACADLVGAVRGREPAGGRRTDDFHPVPVVGLHRRDPAVVLGGLGRYLQRPKSPGHRTSWHRQLDCCERRLTDAEAGGFR